jgi:hypothetical protein
MPGAACLAADQVTITAVAGSTGIVRRRLDSSCRTIPYVQRRAETDGKVPEDRLDPCRQLGFSQLVRGCHKPALRRPPWITDRRPPRNRRGGVRKVNEARTSEALSDVWPLVLPRPKPER